MKVDSKQARAQNSRVRIRQKSGSESIKTHTGANVKHDVPNTAPREGVTRSLFKGMKLSHTLRASLLLCTCATSYELSIQTKKGTKDKCHYFKNLKNSIISIKMEVLSYLTLEATTQKRNECSTAYDHQGAISQPALISRAKPVDGTPDLNTFLPVCFSSLAIRLIQFERWACLNSKSVSALGLGGRKALGVNLC